MNDFKSFIENEKNFSIDFFQHNQIYDRNIDINDYAIIEIVFKNSNLIESIYNVIDELLYTEKMCNKLRYLVIGDFLSTISTFDIGEPSTIIFKINRTVYIQKIQIRALLNICLNCDYYKYIYFHKKLLVALRAKKLILREIINVKNKNKWETNIYFTLNINTLNILSSLNPVLLSIPYILLPVLNTKLIIGSFRNIIQLKRKKKEMDDFVINYDSVIKSIQICFKLSNFLHRINMGNIIKEKNKLLQECGCENIDEYFEKIMKIMKDRDYCNILLKGKEIIEHVNYKSLIYLKYELKKEYESIMKNFQKFIGFYNLDRIGLEKDFYLPSFVDNRGRQYYSGLVSPTFYVLYRYLYEFSKKKKFVNLKDSIYYKKIISNKNLVEQLNLNEENSYILLVLYIEVGKFFIKNNDKCFFTLEDIIKCGINNFNNKNKNLEFDDLIYLEKIYYYINCILKNEEIDINTIIFKDATASGLQNYGILLKYKKDMLEYLNLNGDNWCDTYLYLINRFLKKECILRKRKYWKSTIMTIPYNSEWFSCFIKFLDALKEDGIIYSRLNESEKEEIKNTHFNFYNDIKNKVKKEFFINESGDYIKFNYNKWRIVNTQEYKINYKKNRDKYTNILYMINEDEEATLRAQEANNMHYLDAQLVKEILKFFEVITIHDCFGIRLCELHLVMDKINEYYSLKIGEDTYNPNIII